MTDVPRRPGIRAQLGLQTNENQDDPDPTIEIPVEEILAVGSRRRSALRRVTDRTSAAIQRQDGRKLLLALITMVAMMAIVVVFPRAELSARAICALIAILLTLVWLRVIRGSEASGVERARVAFEGEVSPSRKAKRILIPREMPWYEEQEHPIVLVPWVLGWLAGVLVLGFIPSLEARFIAITVLSVVVGLIAIYWKRRRICFTNWRAFSTEGIFSRTVKQMAFGKMTDLSYKVPLHSLILTKLRVIDRAYGTLVLESAGQDQALHRLSWLRDVESVYRRLSQMSAPASLKEGDGT